MLRPGTSREDHDMPLFRHRDAYQELRKSPRHEVDYLAFIDPGEPREMLNCIICDISASGAKLTVGQQHEIPDEFTLVFRRRCRVVRRSEGQLGIQFVRGG
jgi:hypothetical protein